MRTQIIKQNKKNLNQNYKKLKLKKNGFTNQKKEKVKKYHIDLYKEEFQYDMWPGFIDD